MPRNFKSHRPKPARSAGRGATPGSESPAKPGAEAKAVKPSGKPTGRPKEIGGPSGPEPTRYGDWERNGICVDF